MICGKLSEVFFKVVNSRSFLIEGFLEKGSCASFHSSMEGSEVLSEVLSLKPRHNI